MKPIRGGLLSASVLLLLALSPATSWATFPGANGRIAYGGQPDGSPYTGDDIYGVLPNGTSPLRLTTSPRDEYYPAWSADGRRIAFSRRVRTGVSQIFTIRANGSAETQVTHERTYALGPYFLPNGRRIVYWAGRDHGTALFKIRTDGTERRRIVKGGSVYEPEFGPGGKRITFAGAPEGRGNGIWTVRPDGSHLRRLTKPGPCCYEGGPDFNPDGRHIAFSRCDYTDPSYDDCTLYLMRADGSHEHPILHPGLGSLIYGPVYSPAGDRIAFSIRPSHYDIDFSNVYTVAVDGSDPQAVTDNEESRADSPSWQPIPQP